MAIRRKGPPWPLALAFLAVIVARPAQASWRFVDFPQKTTVLRGVALSPGGDLIVSGSQGVAAVSRDRGRSWRLLDVPGTAHLDFRGLAAPDRATLLLMSAGDGALGRARIFRSGDRGNSWALVFASERPGAFLDALRFWNSRRGMAIGDPLGGRWMVLRTEDGGRSWNELPGPAAFPADTAFAASNSSLILRGSREAWILGGGAASARVLRSTDSGSSWRAAETPIAGGPSGGLFAGAALPGGELVAVGGDHRDAGRPGPNVAVSVDRGVRWSAADPVPDPGLWESVAVIDARRLIAVGPQGSWTSVDGGRVWKRADHEPFHAVACRQDRCLAVGDQGRVAWWVDTPPGRPLVPAAPSGPAH